MKTFFCSMYEISSYYDRDFLIHEIFISWRFHDPYPKGTRLNSILAPRFR